MMVTIDIVEHKKKSGNRFHLHTDMCQQVERKTDAARQILKKYNN